MVVIGVYGRHVRVMQGSATAPAAYAGDMNVASNTASCKSASGRDHLSGIGRDHIARGQLVTHDADEP